MRLVLFDLGTTLVDRAEGFRRWAWEFSAEHRLNADDAAWLIAADDAGRADRTQFFRDVRTRFGLAASEEALAEAYLERCPSLVPAAPGVLTGLPRLRAAGWRIGVVGEGDHQLAALLCTGISGLVDGWAIAGPDGLSTSDTELLSLAAARCEAGLEDAWLVSADVTAGLAAGLRTVRISPERDETRESDTDGGAHEPAHGSTSGARGPAESVRTTAPAAAPAEPGAATADRPPSHSAAPDAATSPSISTAPGAAAAQPLPRHTAPDTATAIAMLLGWS